MKHPVVIGLQYGDEGKGKVTDFLAEQSDYVIRFNGGNNAGHTLYLNKNKVVTHSVPSGVLYDHVQNFIGASCVVNASSLKQELEEISKAGVQSLRDRLKVDHRAHLILPIHIKMDELREGSSRKIGSTKRGIGPAYMTKMDRTGFQVGQLIEGVDLEERLRFLCDSLNPRFVDKGIGESSFEENLQELMLAKEFFDGLVSWEKTPFYELSSKKRCLLEGAQGVMLDLDHGSYPYVTSSSTIGAQASIGAPFPMRKIGNVFGIAKAYLTRVGEGPMASELNGETAEKLREAGQEYGATTGRPRRVGWLNLDELKTAVRLSDCNGIVLTKADILNGFSEVSVYRDSEFVKMAPWGESVIDGALSSELESFISTIEEYVEVPVVAVGTGADRNDIVWRVDKATLWETIGVS